MLLFLGFIILHTEIGRRRSKLIVINNIKYVYQAKSFKLNLNLRHRQKWRIFSVYVFDVSPAFCVHPTVKVKVFR